MEVVILDEDLNEVEQALVAELIPSLEAYDKGDNGLGNDMKIASLKRVLAAIGRPYTTIWNSKKNG